MAERGLNAGTPQDIFSGILTDFQKINYLIHALKGKPTKPLTRF